MTYFCTLASGSSGNCAVYAGGRARILIDAGKNTRYITEGLRRLALSPGELTHILVTHSHSDHISALPVLLKHTGAALVCSEETLEALAGRLPAGQRVLPFSPGRQLELAGCPVNTFATLHDAPGSCGYVLGEGREQVAFCTDTGTVTGEIFAAMQGCAAAVLEFNHDAELLKNGPYPYALKLRILSEQGHLSNRFSAKVAVRLCQEGTRHVTLAHLSRENNTPELAMEALQTALRQAGLSPEVALAPREQLGRPVFL